MRTSAAACASESAATTVAAGSRAAGAGANRSTAAAIVNVDVNDRVLPDVVNDKEGLVAVGEAAEQVLLAIQRHADAGEHQLRLLLLDLGHLAERERLLQNLSANEAEEGDAS